MIVSDALVMSKTHTYNSIIMNELKNNSFVKLLVVALIFLPSLLSTLSPTKSWGGGLYAQIPNAVFDANDAHKGVLCTARDWYVFDHLASKYCRSGTTRIGGQWR